MGKELRVRFFARQSAEELYKNVETKRVYVRQPANVDEICFWLSGNKWQGGYEADCPIKAGIEMVVVDKFDNELFREVLEEDTWNGGTSAKKMAPFLDDAIRAYSLEKAEQLLLAPCEQWSKWLWDLGKEWGYTGYRDNWLYCECMELKSKVLEEKTILGKEYQLVQQDCKHKICNQSWRVIFVQEKGEIDCERICGYIFD